MNDLNHLTDLNWSWAQMSDLWRYLVFFTTILPFFQKLYSEAGL